MNNTDKIKEAKLIQRMIVDKSDADEINKLVLRVITGADIVHIVVDYDNSLYCTDSDSTEVDLGDCYYSHETQYTTSLDACQSLMLEGWLISIQESKVAGGFKCILYYAHLAEVASPHFKIMPEAWLHAILQSYIYEWSNEDD